MKRYWKSIILFVFIIGTFGFFYVQIAIANASLPKFEFVSVSGDEEYLDRLIIYGDYVRGEVREPFKLTNEGMVYQRELNYIKQFQPFHRPESIERLHREERKFMRGRHDIWNTFVEDDDRLVHVTTLMTMEDYSFELDVLERKTGEINSFSIKLPEENAGVSLSNVQLHGDLVYLIANVHSMNKNELHVYEFSLQEGKLLNQKLVAETDDGNDIYVLNDELDFSPYEYIVYKINYLEYKEDDYGYEVVDKEYFSYHLDSGEKNMIEIPEDFNEYPEDPFVEEGHFLPGQINVGKEFVYFIDITSEGIEYHPYSIREAKLGEKTTITLDEAVMGGVYSVYPARDEIFFYSQGEDQEGHQFRKVIAVDLEKATQTFEGEIKLVKAPKETIVYDLEMYDIQIRE